jgi:hypothetical protein
VAAIVATAAYYSPVSDFRWAERVRLATLLGAIEHLRPADVGAAWLPLDTVLIASLLATVAVAIGTRDSTTSRVRWFALAYSRS